MQNQLLILMQVMDLEFGFGPPKFYRDCKQCHVLIKLSILVIVICNIVIIVNHIAVKFLYGNMWPHLHLNLTSDFYVSAEVKLGKDHADATLEVPTEELLRKSKWFEWRISFLNSCLIVILFAEHIVFYLSLCFLFLSSFPFFLLQGICFFYRFSISWNFLLCNSWTCNKKVSLWTFKSEIILDMLWIQVLSLQTYLYYVRFLMLNSVLLDQVTSQTYLIG